MHQKQMKKKIINTDKILEDLKNKGFATIESFLDKETIDEIENDTTKNRYELNKNSLNGIYYETQYYFMHLLAESKKCYEFLISDFVINLCKDYLGNIFRLRALRYYETMSGHNMSWHTDNKKDRELTKYNGLIFIIYISDTYEGEFQFIEGSHKLREQFNSPEFDNNTVETKYSHLIRSFKMPKGSLIIYDATGIHRAKPFKNSKFIRKSLYFQVDATNENGLQILINPNFLKEINRDVEMLLGFGKESNYPVYPKTNLNMLPINKPILTSVLKWFFYRSVRFIIRTGPRNIKKYIASFLKK